MSRRDYRIRQVLEMDACTQCRLCAEVCPAVSASKDGMLSALYRMKGLKEILKSRIGLYRWLFGTKGPSEEQRKHYSSTVFRCTLCAGCQEVCPVGIGLKDLWLSLRQDLVHSGNYPKKIEMIRDNLKESHNVFAEANEERADWVGDMRDAPEHGYVKERAEVVYFTGCVAAYFPLAQKIPMALAEILDAAGVDFTLLGEDEWCCGFPLLGAGLREMLQEFMNHNVEAVRRKGAGRIVFACPSCYQIWREHYPREFELAHASELLAQLIRQRQIPLKDLPLTVTYHDPCDLGRGGRVFEEPREVIRAIPGVNLVELPKNRENCQCCGGGGNLEMVDAELSAAIAGRKIEEVTRHWRPGGRHHLPAVCANHDDLCQEEQGARRGHGSYSARPEGTEAIERGIGSCRMETWRLLDTPPMTAAENMALDDALVELKGGGATPNTIHFLQFYPRAVLVGFHQSVKKRCAPNTAGLMGFMSTGASREGERSSSMRASSAGKSSVTSRSLTWHSRPEGFSGRSAIPSSRALAILGVESAFRPRNDIEINGRKISGTGGTESDGAFLFQGTMLTDFDVDTMLKSLRIPIEKLKAKEIDSIRERVTCLKWELGVTPPLEDIKRAIRTGFEQHLGIRLEPGELTAAERQLFEEKLEYYQSSEWIDHVKPEFEKGEVVQAAHKTDAGLVRFTLVVNLPRKRLKDVYITGDFLSFPTRALFDLEARLRGVPLDYGHIRRLVVRFL